MLVKIYLTYNFALFYLLFLLKFNKNSKGIIINSLYNIFLITLLKHNIIKIKKWFNTLIVALTFILIIILLLYFTFIYIYIYIYIYKGF